MIWFLLACSDNGTERPPGDPARYDVVGSYAAIAAFAGEGAQLTGMSAHGVRSDGTVDLTSELLFGADYQFVREVKAPADAPPVGAGGSADGRYHEVIDVRLWQPGQLRHVSTGRSSYDYRHKGMERTGSVQ